MAKTVVNKRWIRQQAAEITYVISGYQFGDIRDHAWKEACNRGRGSADLEWAIYQMWWRHNDPRAWKRKNDGRMWYAPEELT